MAVFYVLCDDDCRYEGMTREQILTAIQEAVAQGYVSDPDNAVFSKIKDIHASAAIQIWVGTEAEFNALSPSPTVGKAVVRMGADGVMYICKDDSTLDVFTEWAYRFETIDKHMNNKNNPHGVTAAQVGAAKEKHTHSLDEVGVVISETEPTNPTENMLWLKI